VCISMATEGVLKQCQPAIYWHTSACITMSKTVHVEYPHFSNFQMFAMSRVDCAACQHLVAMESDTCHLHFMEQPPQPT
jgi:hypothetical protein